MNEKAARQNDDDCCNDMTATNVKLTEVSRPALRLQIITIVWMIVEAGVSISAAWHGRSPALLAFGGDSLIELFSAGIVLWRFRFRFDEGRAAKIAGALLFVLAGLVVLSSALSFIGYGQAKPSLIGISALLAAAIAMPLLARAKRKLALAVSSASLKADAAESAVCGYMAYIALAGLVMNMIWRLSWADPLAGAALTPLIIREGWQALGSQQMCCHCSG
jgi:divalent metal cation (Fe/Co/Zn/Cd) transporter